MESVAQPKGKTHVTVRLSDDALLVIHSRQEDLARVKGKTITFTDALEDIILNFTPSLLAQVKRAFHRKPAADQNTKPLEAFLSA